MDGFACQEPEALAAAGPNTSTVADFYVAIGGNDTWPGTLAQPFRTVDRARVAVQGLKANSPARSIGFVTFDPSQAGRLSTATLKAPVNTVGYPTTQPMAITNF
jgi:hypothetical protein